MSRSCIALVIAAASFLAAGSFGSPNQAAAADCGYSVANQALFYTYYIGAGYPGAYPAAMHLCPRPTPPLVGHTFITYQPFHPHEFMYRHHRVYTRRHCHGGTTRTRISYH